MLGGASEAETSSAAKRQRKDRAPNWSVNKVSAFIMAKKAVWFAAQKPDSLLKAMKTDSKKWSAIATVVMAAGHSTFVHDGDACKAKWNELILEYKRIAYYFRWRGTEVTTYWNMQQEWRKSQGLPQTFPHEVFFQIHEWYGREPEMRPPHGCDYHAPENTIYQIPQNASMHVNDEEVFEDADQQMQNNSDGGVDGEGN